MAARNPFASSIPDIFDDPYGLVQSRRPVRHSTGYYFVRNLLLVGAVAGGVVALYRNDVFRDLSRRVGLEQRYLDAEKFLVGTPGWGTPRSMEPVLKPAEGAAAAATPTTTELAAATTAVASPTAPAATATTVAEPAVARTATPEPAAAPPPVTSPASVASPAPSPVAVTAPAVARASRGTDSLSPVSFDSLPTLTHGAAPRAAAAEPPPARAVAPVAVARAVAPAPVAHAAAPRPAPVDHSHAKAIKVSLEEDAPAQPASHHSAPAHAAPPPAPPPAPVATKPEKPEKPQLKATEAHEGDNPLLAAVRGAVRTRPPKSSVPAAE